MRSTTEVRGVEVRLESTYIGPWHYEVTADWTPQDDDDAGSATFELDYCQSHMVALDRAGDYVRDMIPTTEGGPQ